MVDEAPVSACPSAEALAAYLEGRTDAATSAAITAHAAACESCSEVLVEALRTERDLAGATPDVTARRSWRVWYGFGGLAAAAAVLIALASHPEWLTRGRGQPDPRFARLVDAVGEQRFVDARLTSGFRFGPLRSPARSAPGGATQDLQIVAAAGDLQNAAESRATTETLHPWGVALLVLGEWDAAVDALERARSLSPDPPAALLSDLSAAHAARARLTGRGADWPIAVTLAERALAKDPRLPEARFNLAIALEGLGLADQARDAWQRYLEVDSDSPWANEARRRLRNLARVTPAYEDDRARLETSRTITTAAEITARNPQVVREWVEEAVLPAWAASCTQTPGAGTPALLTLAGEASELAARRQGDRYLTEIAGAFTARRNPCDSAQPMGDYARGRQSYLSSDYPAAAAHFDRVIASALAPAPLRELATFYRSLVPYFEGRFDETRTALVHLSETISPGRAVLHGRIHWMLGIIAVGQGRHAEACDHYRTALAAFERIGEPEGIAQAHNLLAEALRDMGDETWWDHEIQAHALGFQIRPQRRHALFLNAVQGALAVGLPTIALRYQQTLGDNARRVRLPTLLAEALQSEFIVRQRLGDSRAAQGTLEAVRAEFTHLPEGPIRRRMSAEMAALEAAASVTTDPQHALEMGQRAIDAFRQEGRERRLPLLYSVTAQAHVARGEPAMALKDLESGLDVLGAQGQRLTGYARASLVDDKWRLVEQAVEVLVGLEPDGRAALDLLDRRRHSASSVADGSGVHATSLPAHVALVQYLVLDDRVLIWSVGSSGTRLRTSPVPKDHLMAAVNRFKALNTPRTDAAQLDAALADVAKIVLWPIAADLGEAQIVMIVADGPLADVPFAALPLENGRRMISRFAIASASSFLAAREWLAREGSRSAPGGGVLVAAVSNAGTAGLPPLTGASMEADAIAAVHSPDRPTLLRNPTAFDFSRAVAGQRIIHFAGHSTTGSRMPRTNALHFAAGDDHGTTLTPAGLAALDLTRSDVVVLAACSSGDGVATRSGGLFGLASALLSAGAGSVVASIWRVDDRATAPLMVAFHKRLRRGDTPVGALRHAQLEFQEAVGDVRQWGAWVVFVGSRDTAFDVRQ